MPFQAAGDYELLQEQTYMQPSPTQQAYFQYDQYINTPTAYAHLESPPPQPLQELPEYDKGTSTKICMKYAYGFCIIISLVFMGIAGPALYWDVTVIQTPNLTYLPGLVTHSAALSIFLTFIFTLITTASTEILAFIHSITLRWGRADEGRLDINSPLRLFSTTLRSWTNGGFANGWWLVCVSSCYGAAANALSRETMDINGQSMPWIRIDGVSFGVYGLALSVQCLIAGIAWWRASSSDRIKTWATDPINTTLACIRHDLLPMQHRLPSQGYASVWRRFPIVRRIVWILAVAAFVFIVLPVGVVVVLLVMKHNQPNSEISWTWFPELTLEYDKTDAHITSRLGLQTHLSPIPTMFVPLVWNILWQSISTLIFHLAELVVHLRQDEANARDMETDTGAQLAPGFIAATFRGKSAIFLFLAKVFGQWIFGLGIYDIGFSPLPLAVFAGILVCLTLLIWIAALRHSRGFLPATYGDIQMLADIINEARATGRLDRAHELSGPVLRIRKPRPESIWQKWQRFSGF